MNKSKNSICNKKIKKNNYNEVKQIVNNLNLSGEAPGFIATLITNKNISNLPEIIFIVNMLSNLQKKLGYTRNTPRTGQRQTRVHPNGMSRKEQLQKLIGKLNKLKEQMINGNQMNKNELKEIIDEIEKFYLGTRRKKNSTRDYFYQQLELLYKCQENNDSIFAKRLRRLLLNKKFSYSNMGQVFSPRSRNRKSQVMRFLQINNNDVFLDMALNNGDIDKFYKDSKKNKNKQLYENFKGPYQQFIKKKGEKSNAELKKKAEQAQLRIQRANQSKQQIQQTEQSQQKQIQQPEQEEENYSLQSKEEENEEKKINQLISALNAFNKSAKIRGLTFQGLTSNKKKVRKELRDKLKEQVELLKKIKIGNQNEKETLNKTMKKIQELFKNYNTKKGSKWTNGANTTTKRKNVNNLLQQIKPIQTVGGSKYVNIKSVGKRKLRYFTNGKKYVLVKGKKVSI